LHGHLDGYRVGLREEQLYEWQITELRSEGFVHVAFEPGVHHAAGRGRHDVAEYADDAATAQRHYSDHLVVIAAPETQPVAGESCDFCDLADVAARLFHTDEPRVLGECGDRRR